MSGEERVAYGLNMILSKQIADFFFHRKVLINLSNLFIEIL